MVNEWNIKFIICVVPPSVCHKIAAQGKLKKCITINEQRSQQHRSPMRLDTHINYMVKKQYTKNTKELYFNN